jgi:hypothetical protein
MPPCIERKYTLSGAVQEFRCEEMLFREGFGVLRYVIDRPYDINGTQLLPGDVTCALYWEDRPYTLYVWRLQREPGVLYYFNIADRVALRTGEFAWRDLVIDIAVDDTGTAAILDDHELPPDLDDDLARYIRSAVDHVLGHYREIIAEADGILAGIC